MNEQDFQKLKSLTKSLHKINGKVKLLALLNRAKDEYDKNKFENCEKTCQEILQTRPNCAVALRGLGCVMQSKGDIEKALEYYNRALEHSKNKEIEYTLIGTIYYNEDNYKKAIEYYNLAIEVNDDYDLAYEGRNQSMLENHLEILDMQDNLIKRNMFK